MANVTSVPGGRPVYLDYQATTPTDPRAVEAMLPYFSETFGNPHSTQHAHGQIAAEAVERARGQIAALIGAEAREIVFTSGATEANNIAIKGAARHRRRRDGRVGIVTLATEHKCVLESCKALEEEGFEVTYLPVRPDGLADLDALASAIGEDTALVSVMAANNEIGVIQPLAEIGALCRERGALLHTDAAQAAGKIPMDMAKMGVGLLSLSGHKLYGPKGIGALYVRRRPRVRLEPLMSGGGQERGLRSGTVPSPLCVGLGVACEIAAREMAEEATRLTALRERLLGALEAGLPGITVNGHRENRLPGNLNVTFAEIDGDALIPSLDGLSVSSGSACTSTEIESSYVLRALGLDDSAARASIRIGLGRFTTEDEIDFAARHIVERVERLRAAAPVVSPVAGAAE